MLTFGYINCYIKNNELFKENTTFSFRNNLIMAKNTESAISYLYNNNEIEPNSDATIMVVNTHSKWSVESEIDDYIRDADFSLRDFADIIKDLKRELKSNDSLNYVSRKFKPLYRGSLGFIIIVYRTQLKESKKSARNSIKESSDIVEKISSEIDKSYWIDKLIDDLDRHYEAMEKAWLKNLDKLSDEDILGIIDDCMGKSKTLVGKSEMLKNKMIDDLSKAYDDYIDDIDRQIRIGKSEDEIKKMIETTLENDIKMYLKLAYNNKASSNYFMVKFAEDNLI